MLRTQAGPLATLLLLAACGDDGGFFDDGDVAVSGPPDPGVADAGSEGLEGPDGQGGGGAGTLTAGVWDDNLNFDRFKQFVDEHAQLPGRPALTDEEQTAAASAASTRTSTRTGLDLVFLIDATGSMSDEIAYLQLELDGVSSRISERFPNVAIRWGLVSYRDRQDAYLTRALDLSADRGPFTRRLFDTAADGGGDYPEASPEGLAAALELGWRGSDEVARVLFWLTDAPHHVQDAEGVTRQLRAARERGVRVHPIASSGVDILSELTMRSAAQLTGGRYLFLTDDSGVGLPHLEPSIPCYFVTRLDQAMVRVITAALTGRHAAVSPEDVIRAEGDPDAEGRCDLGEGSVAFAY